MKTCYTCKESKTLEEFYDNARNKDGKYSSCRVCTLKKQKVYWDRVKDPIKVKTRNLKHRYGLTTEQHDKMMKDGCAVCGTLENLVVDHDHSCCSGKRSCGNCIRGILCWGHNIADGQFKTIDQIEKYLEYRKSYIKA